MSAVAAIDCGTTAIKAAVVDSRGRILATASRPAACLRTPEGLAELDALQLESDALACLAEAVQQCGLPPSQIVAISVTAQRATVVGCSAAGEPIANAISWQDRRGVPQIRDLRAVVEDARYQAVTGLPNDPVFSLAKILWLKQNQPASRRFALICDFLLHRLGADAFYCDWSNASLTGLLDVTALDWSDELLEATGLARDVLPELVPPGCQVGVLSAGAARRTRLLEGTPLVAGGGDQQCAGVGAGAVVPGVVEITLGTAAVPLSYLERPAIDPMMRVTCCAHAVPGRWCLEGLQSCAGASLEWLRQVLDGPGRFEPAALQQAVDLAPGATGVLFYPFLLGASAPHWDADASGAFMGLTAAHGRPALLRAVLEGVTFQTRQILDVFRDLGVAITEVRLTGGGTGIHGWTQMQADVFGLSVSTLRTPHATVLGAAILAACGVGLYPSVKAAVEAMVSVGEVCAPRPEAAEAYQWVYARYVDVLRGLQEAGAFHCLAGRDR